MVKSKLSRKSVELGRKRIPLRKLLHGKEIREAAKSLEDFRLNFNEEEILLGAKLTIKMDTYGEAILYAHRPETDKEYEDRLEKERLAAEAKADREKKRKIREEQLAKEQEELKKKQALNKILEIAKSNNLNEEELAKLLKGTNG